RADNFNLQALN
ncbi:hypothetical protein VCHC59A1_1057, partial [Vibrio cholerae HC-59A1]